MQIGIFLGLLFLGLIPLGFLLLAWRAWMKKDQRPSATRRRLFTVAIVVTSIAFAIYISFSIHSSRTPGAIGNTPTFLVWIRAGFWTSIAGFLLSLFGRGRGRAWTVVSAGLMTILWALFASTG